MPRLTKPLDEAAVKATRMTHAPIREIHLADDRMFNDSLDAYRDIVNKLGQLEDIEEELGVDLITLLRELLDCGIVWVRLPYIPENNGVLPKIIVVNIAVEAKWSFKKPCYFKLEIGNLQFVFYLSDYGRTWALTKGELK